MAFTSNNLNKQADPVNFDGNIKNQECLISSLPKKINGLKEQKKQNLTKNGDELISQTQS